MRVLALETATMAGSIAIMDDNRGLIGEARIDVKVAHAERLMNTADWLLRTSGISINEIDAFAISIGPGSFTGLRIGLSTVKGFSYATGKPVVPVSTLDAFARALPFCSHFICPMLDARKNEVYTGLYKWEGNLCRSVLPVTAVKPGDFLKEIKRPVVFLGEGAKIHKKLITETLGADAFYAPASKMSPSASDVAGIAIAKLNKGILTDPVSLKPFYIRKSEAEIHWKG